MKVLQFASLLLACRATTTAAKSILEIAKDGENFSTLVAALKASGLAHLFDEPWYCKWWSCPDYTVFAPTDDAFDDLPDDALDRLLKKKDFRPHLKDLLSYHAVKGKITSSQITNGAKVETLNKEEVTASVDTRGTISLNADNEDSTVIDKDTEASNGVVHAIDKVLLPQSMSNIAEIASSNDVFSLLVEALAKADLVGTISGAGPFTVFAPTNAAFEAAGIDSDYIDEAAAEDLEQVLLYHVVQGDVKTSLELLTGGDITTAQGSAIEVGWGGRRGGKKSLKLNGDVSIDTADILASNGIIHVIDAVLTLPGPVGNIAAVASKNTDFSLLVKALTKADLVDTLTGDGPFTVFAPTNAAFKAAGIDSDYIDETAGEDLAPVLLYHVLPGNVPLAELKRGEVATAFEKDGVAQEVTVRPYRTWSGLKAYVKGDANKDSWRGWAKVIDADVQASNGVIHAINGVLLPDLN